jgi:branched-chain amino acid transport system ATP-binding protein
LKEFLELQSVTVKYDKSVALRGVSLRVPDRGITTLIGANGAGKTTTLRAISGLVNLESGEIWFNGLRIDRLRPEKRVALGIAQSPEGRRVFPYMSVRENLMTGAYLRRDRKAIKGDFQVVLTNFPRLKERLTQKGGSLSGGEQQMLAIGRALMASPKLMLLDEPTMGLSPLLVREVLKIVKDINDTKGVALLLIEQNAQIALEMAEIGYILENGFITMTDKANLLLGSAQIRNAYLGG